LLLAYGRGLRYTFSIVVRSGLGPRASVGDIRPTAAYLLDTGIVQSGAIGDHNGCKQAWLIVTCLGRDVSARDSAAAYTLSPKQSERAATRATDA
jgi:hypothetical protein